MGLLGFCSTGASCFDTGAMSSMKLGSSRGYQPMGERIKLKHNQGDIFALQLRGHIAFA